jgi:hypothetical protein
LIVKVNHTDAPSSLVTPVNTLNLSLTVNPKPLTIFLILKTKLLTRANRAIRRATPLIAMPLALSACFSIHASQSASLAWNAGTNTSGYILYAGNTATNYSTQINVGTNTTVTLTGLKEGTTNYFAVSAYNSANVTGNLSAPISYIVPGLLIMTPSVGGTNLPPLTFPTAVGHWYAIQASTNLTMWTNVFQTATATTNVWASYQDPQGSSFSQRFYRLVMH